MKGKSILLLVKMICEKKGSHVGLVLSFVVFVTFLIFLYTLIEPSIRIQRDKQSLLDYLERELTGNFSEEMTTVTIRINESENPNQECIEFDGLITEIGIGPQTIIKNELGSILSFYISEGGDLEINRDDEENLFFSIYYSEKFDDANGESTIPCKKLNKESKDYILGSTRTEEYIFGRIIEEMIERYGEDYELLKEELKIPPGNEFGFSFTYSDGGIIGTEEKEILTSVYAREVPIQYIDEEANIRSGFLNFRIW